MSDFSPLLIYNKKWKGDYMNEEIKKVDWSKQNDSNFRNIGPVIMHGQAFYNYDDDCWRYAPDVYFEYVVDAPRADVVTEAEARKIVEENGGKNFNNLDEVLYKTDKDGLYSGLD